ncbi:MAG: CTP-dependent riboflavin kinase [Thaumarchaeota archaeon]|nr:CTP-dependent riboflavin kinase [Nitrososphaerota archaeon]
MELRGSVFSGIGKGRYYVGHPEYQKRFEASLGYRPYPGTLNVRVRERASEEALKELRSAEGIRIGSFAFEGEGFSALNCFEGKMMGERVTLLLIEITHYNESVAELISPVYLRGKFGLEDGQEVRFELEGPVTSRRALRPGTRLRP